jgi:hypothetical protein
MMAVLKNILEFLTEIIMRVGLEVSKALDLDSIEFLFCTLKLVSFSDKLGGTAELSLSSLKNKGEGLFILLFINFIL